jgi:phosphoribosylformimino-5-aminoimidazole carboxamide ribotide isomerase
MEVIPVIDLKGGAVVHARRGERGAYRPIQTPLSEGSRPIDVVGGLMLLAPFRRLYVADLDAIAGEVGHSDTLEAIAAAYPCLELWVDAGFGEAGAIADFLARGMGTLVLGSESQSSAELARALGRHPHVVLSLDYRGEEFQGPAELEADPALWPDRVIAMTLSRVGAEAGPDLHRLRAVLARAGGRQVYGAGGVRHRTDLEALAAVGAAGALVATALHSSALSPSDLAAVAG